MDVGLILGDVHRSVSPADHLDGLLRQVDAAQRAGISWIVMGHHYLYGEYRWLQPIPTMARLAPELDPNVRLGTFIVQVPLLHPVTLAEDLATADLLTGGRLTIGLGAGYRPDEFIALGIPFEERFARFEESVELIQRLWTEETVTHHGRFFDLESVTPHISPRQQPRPPLWIGAMGPQGVRRAARLGDAWPITPEATIDKARSLLAVYEDERDQLGLPQTLHPIRREIAIGKNYDDAFNAYESMVKERLLAYAQRSLATRNEEEIANAFREVAEREAFIGTPDDVVTKVQAMATQLPVDPLIIRAQWPGMTADDVVAYLDELGQHVVPALKAITPVDRVQRANDGADDR